MYLIVNALCNLRYPDGFKSENIGGVLFVTTATKNPGIYVQLFISMDVFIHHHVISLDTNIRFHLKNRTVKQRDSLQSCRL